MLSLSLLVALLLDRLFAEVSRNHPLVFFGTMANRAEARYRKSAEVKGNVAAASGQRWAGTYNWCLLVLPPTALLIFFQSMASDFAVMIAGTLALYFCIGGRSLTEHAQAIAAPLASGNMVAAREKLARIVSRDTGHLDKQAVTNATIESVLENGSDALLAPLFWYVVAGAPGVLCYRLSNTLDAMWGYRNERYVNFGRTAARIDDVMNWLPARCCAISYALAGRSRAAFRCWLSQAPLCDSPNAGPVMAAGAGALGVRVGGAAVYGNETHWRPFLGDGRDAQPQDIKRALALLRRATGIWLLAIVLYEGWSWI